MGDPLGNHFAESFLLVAVYVPLVLPRVHHHREDRLHGGLGVHEDPGAGVAHLTVVDRPAEEEG